MAANTLEEYLAKKKELVQECGVFVVLWHVWRGRMCCILSRIVIGSSKPRSITGFTNLNRDNFGKVKRIIEPFFFCCRTPTLKPRQRLSPLLLLFLFLSPFFFSFMFFFCINSEHYRGLDVNAHIIMLCFILLFLLFAVPRDYCSSLLNSKSRLSWWKPKTRIV